MMANCPLCHASDELVLWRDETLRVILVSDHDYPAFCRVILNRHASEMTDLPCALCPVTTRRIGLGICVPPTLPRRTCSSSPACPASLSSTCG